MAIATVMTIAEPKPSITRPTNNTGRFGDVALTLAPNAIVSIPAMYTRFLPRMSDNRPMARSTALMVRASETMTHDATARSSSRSSAILGRAIAAPELAITVVN